MKKLLGIIVSIILVVVVVLSVTLLYFINKQKEQDLCNEISRKTYDIVEESYINYGNISYSKYKSIISEFDYDAMYYIHETEYIDNEEKKIDRSKCDFLITYHSFPETVLNSKTEATTTYSYKVQNSVYTQKPKNRDGYTYYDKNDYTGAMGECTVKWKLQDDGQWHIVDFMDPP